MTSFGELLKRHRLAAGLPQEALAERARMSASAIGALERGVRLAPYRETVALLASALGLSGADHSEFEAAAERARVRKGTAVATQRPVPHNLPERLTSFIGRDAEMTEIEGLLLRHRLVTVTGSGGVGKTSIALAVGRRLEGGRYEEVRFVDLTRLADGALVVGAIGDELGASTTQSTDPLSSLVANLKTRDLLLILDNCEHVVDASATSAAAILRSCPGVTILATSRERLAISGECVFRLPSLAIPVDVPGTIEEAYTYAALRLFSERALALESRLVFTTERLGTIVGICRQLEGIPLAVEMAATRLPSLGFDALDRRLKEHFVLASGARDLPQRQRTMLATIEWSFDLLCKPERLLLCRLAIFRGGASLDAVEQVCAGDGLAGSSIAHILSRLLDKSLVSVTSPDEHGRYVMFESIRTFASNKLAESGEYSALARAHARWMADVADRGRELYVQLPPSVWFSRYEPELDNARAALEWTLNGERYDDTLLGARVVGGLRQIFVWKVGRRIECRRWAEAALARIDEARDPSIAAYVMQAYIHSLEGAAGFVEAARRALPSFEGLEDRRPIIWLLSFLARHYGNQGRAADAAASVSRALAIAEAEGIVFSAQYVDLLITRNQIYFSSGRYAEARAGVAEQHKLEDAIGGFDPVDRLTWESQFAYVEGDVARCAELLEEILDLRSEGQYRESRLLNNLSAARIVLGDFDAARVAARRALEQSRFEDHAVLWRALQHLATAAAVRGDARVAARLTGFVNAFSAREDDARDAFERAGYDILTNALRAQLGPDAIEKLAAEGARLDVNHAIDEALAT